MRPTYFTPTRANLTLANAGRAIQETFRPTSRSNEDTLPNEPMAKARRRNLERPARRADALVALLERGTTATDPEIRPNPTEIIVHIDAETLKGGESTRADHPDLCKLEHGPRLAPDTARRLACDGAIVHLAENADGEPLSIGRRSRAVPAPMRRALHARDRGCRFPGCTATHRLEAHHIRHWATGGETSTRNLAELCPAHHRLVHEGGYGMEHSTDRRLRFIQPDGTPIPDHPPPRRIRPDEAIPALRTAERESGVHTDARTSVPSWDGYPLDVVWAVESVLQADGRLFE